MKKVKVRSKQPDIKVIRHGMYNFTYEFQTTEDEIEMPLVHAEVITANPTFEIIAGSMNQDDQDEIPDEMGDFRRELEKIKGVGKKTAKDIVAVFPKADYLKKAIKNNNDLPFDDDIVEKLKEKYGGD